jgi:hypothetical protein
MHRHSFSMPTQMCATTISSSVHWNMMARRLCRNSTRQTSLLGSLMSFLGMPSARAHVMHMPSLDFPVVQLPGLDEHFTEQEILAVIRSMPQDKASGPNGFTALFLQQAWDIIWPLVMKVFDAFRHCDTRSLHLVNDALMILLPKKANVASMRDFHPIVLPGSHHI